MNYPSLPLIIDLRCSIFPSCGRRVDGSLFPLPPSVLRVVQGAVLRLLLRMMARTVHFFLSFLNTVITNLSVLSFFPLKMLLAATLSLPLEKLLLAELLLFFFLSLMGSKVLPFRRLSDVPTVPFLLPLTCSVSSLPFC